MINWKSTVQRTVTKSTTESELLSLLLTASQMEEWMQFFAGINLTLDCTPTIWCDNQQTVGIVTKQHNKLHTKVKHISTSSGFDRRSLPHKSMFNGFLLLICLLTDSQRYYQSKSLQSLSASLAW
ncbi:hypothetical protein BU25DRAFT_222960 [Macroventuria anomochaeta]|uniref:Uncharacterized protein n=1 Tax=Macroventuria anomochaeta TaxID=301207 RepID=A0ACB6SAD1_9PLEO|nr:uncharacterized protein BU25DRAFT_222960 [Macroventuria anomochaeta]KAF2631008.1 hypothetical protein BU25DRAFT_222960 [Macroventuria anomochaeta]